MFHSSRNHFHRDHERVFIPRKNPRKEARISPLGLKSKINRHRFLAHVANDPATKVSRINDWQRRYKRRGKNPGEQPGLISQAKQDRRARTLMKTNRDDVRGTHAAIYSSTNGLARVSPPLFLPPRIGRIVAPREKNPFDGNTNGRKRRRIALLPYGAFVCIHPAHPPLLSSPLLEKARPFSVEQGETWQKRGGRRSAYAKRAYPRLCHPFFLSQRGTLTLFVHTCAPIQRGFFRGTHEPERRLGNLGERTSLGMPAVVGEGARVCVQGCIIKVQRNLSGWRGPQHGKVVSRLWMCYISRRCCFDHVRDHFSPGFGNCPIVRARLSSISPDFGEFIERVYSWDEMIGLQVLSDFFSHQIFIASR